MSVFEERIRVRARLVNVAADKAWDAEAAMAAVEFNLDPVMASDFVRDRDTARQERMNALLVQMRDIRAALYGLLLDVSNDR